MNALMGNATKTPIKVAVNIPSPAHAPVVVPCSCQRIHGRVPAGVVTISGEFLADHQQEILGLIHNIEAKEKSEHPLQRVMSLTQNDDSITVLLTDFHLTHAIVEALKSAYQGEAEQQFVDKDGVMRASWKR
jgi:hypothetical protein